MTDSSPFASLSASLLARKGHAKPAMRPQGFPMHRKTAAEDLEDLGWNDLGEDTAPARIVAFPANSAGAVNKEPSLPVPVQQQDEIAREFAVPRQSQARGRFTAPKAPREQAGTKAKAAFTLRLDGDRHLRLRLVCAVRHRSAQQIVTQALDEFLARQPINTDLARSHLAPRAFAPTGDEQ
jgi:hypothetical protein